MQLDSTELPSDGTVAWRSAAAEPSPAVALPRLAQSDARVDGDTKALGQPLVGPGDPRWVLAVRAAEAMEGSILRPEKRQRVLRVGTMLGLSLFDSNLVIAIVQDQARRGYAPDHCPGAGEKQLTMVPLPDAHLPWSQQSRRRRMRNTLTLTTTIATVLVAEAFLVWWLFF